jgi:purine-nucleoside phosphorylase
METGALFAFSQPLRKRASIICTVSQGHISSYNKRDGGFMCVVLSIGKPLYLVMKTVDYGSPS